MERNTGANAKHAWTTTTSGMSGVHHIIVHANVSSHTMQNSRHWQHVVCRFNYRLRDRKRAGMDRLRSDLGPQLQPTQPFMNKQILRHYCAPLAVSAALLWFYTTSYRFVIEWFWGAEILGTFAFAYIFASQIWAVFEALMTQFIYPYFYRTLSVSASDMPAKAFCHL
ncbi:conserved hypothetical protein, partial [Ricinus communis]